MTTYTSIPNSDVDQDSPVTQPLLTAFRDNPIAISEGSTGAPYQRSAWHPYDGLLAGDGNDGVFYDASVDGSLATVESPAFVDGYEYAFVFDGVSSSSSPLSFQAALYRDTDGSYSPYVDILSGLSASTEEIYGVLLVQMPRFAKYSHSFSPIATIHAFRTDTGSVTAESNSVATVTTAQNQTVSSAKFRFNAGSISAGKISMLRRREHLTG